MCVLRCQFHQRFYVRIFCTNVVLAAFSSYVLALAKNSYEIRARKMLMKLTEGRQHVPTLPYHSTECVTNLH